MRDEEIHFDDEVHQNSKNKKIKSDKKLRTKCSLFAQGVIADEKWDSHSSDSMSSSENK